MKLSLRGKSVLLLTGYALVLEGSILAYFYYSGKGSIESRSDREVRTQASLSRSAVEGVLAESLAELAGLRSQLLMYPMPAGPKDAGMNLVSELVVAPPQKYAEIGFVDRASRRVFAVRAVGEFSGIYPVVESRTEEQPSAGCPPGPGDADPGPPCVLGLLPRPREELLKIVVPLTPGSSRVLVAHLRLEFVLDAIGRIATPPNLSVLAANRRGLILYATEAPLLRTFLQNSAPDLGFAPSREPPLDEAAPRLPGRSIRWEHLRQPEVVLAVQKDETTDIRDLRMKLLNVGSFTAAFTLLAFLGVWAVTGRMASSLGRVTEVANSVASGDFSRRIPIRRSDELGLLIDSFNSMTARLEASYRELSEANRQLQSKIEELTRARRRLSQKQRLALLGEAISKISHEIQNKIGGADIWVQNLERYGAKDENTALCIRELKAALASFLDMLVRFKRFYREPPLAKQRVPAKELIGTCLTRVSAELRMKELSVVEDLGPDTVCLDVDPAQMTDAIVNILLNAAYFSPRGGVLSVGLRRDNEQVFLSFRDQGPGLEAKAKLFQPFYTTRPAGSGLGLVIVRNIVHAHSGRIRGYNSAEGGACFEIRLPAGPQEG